MKLDIAPDDLDEVSVAHLYLRQSVNKAITSLVKLRQEMRNEGDFMYASDVLQVIVTLREGLE